MVTFSDSNNTLRWAACLLMNCFCYCGSLRPFQVFISINHNLKFKRNQINEKDTCFSSQKSLVLLSSYSTVQDYDLALLPFLPSALLYYSCKIPDVMGISFCYQPKDFCGVDLEPFVVYHHCFIYGLADKNINCRWLA